MPSGLEVNYPENAELPSLDIAQAFAKGSGTFNVLLGVPLWQGSRANTVPLSQDSDTRVKLLYRVGEVECYDENTGENPKPVQVRKINSRLMFEHEDGNRPTRPQSRPSCSAATDSHAWRSSMPRSHFAHGVGRDRSSGVTVSTASSA